MYDQEKPATFLNRPLTRAQLRKKYMRRVKRSDINWKDSAMLVKLGLNPMGKILNRYQSRLPSSVHTKVAHTIKRLKHINLIPWVGVIKPTDKISLGSHMKDLEEMNKKIIDPVTGRLFIKDKVQLENERDEVYRQKKFAERFDAIKRDPESEEGE
jgi:ribosomal protein S18